MTDYVVETTVSYELELGAEEEGVATQGARRFNSMLMARVGETPETGLPANFYALQFLAGDAWGGMPTPEQLAEAPRRGGQLRIFRFGPNATISSTVSNFIESEDGYIPSELTVRLRLSIVGSSLIGQLFDMEGNLLATVSAVDETPAHAVGSVGVRAISTQSIVKFDDFNVYEPFAVSPPPMAASALRLQPVNDRLELLIPTEPGRFYQIQQRTEIDGGEDWEQLRAFEGTGDQETALYVLENGLTPDDFRVRMTGAAINDLPVLYSTDFSGNDNETPEGWNLRMGDPFFGTRYLDHYDFDFRFGETNMTFLAILETEGAHEWTDYLITTTASSQRVETPVFDYNDTIGLVARISLGEINHFYHPRLWPRVDWPGDWQSTGDKGGRLEIFRLGGAGNASLSLVSGVLDPDPEPDLNTAGSPVPAPARRTVTMHFAVMGENLINSLWDEEGSFVAQTSAVDSSISQGAPGIRVPALRDAIVSFDNFRVYDLSAVDFDAEAPGVARVVIPHIEIRFDAPVSLYDYQIQESLDLFNWMSFDEAIAVRSGVRGFGAPSRILRLDGDKGFFRVLTAEVD